MATPETFGLSLRRARQHRGISLDEIAAATNVKLERWEEMERNDFTLWPTGVYARTWIRAYAEYIGLDADRVVDDFCRWFPQGDRRAETAMRRHAALIGHELAWSDDRIPPGGDRRAAAAAATPPARRLHIHHFRAIAAAGDLAIVATIVGLITALGRTAFWPTLGLVTTSYFVLSIALTGGTPAVMLLDGFVFQTDTGWRVRLSPFRLLRSTDLPAARG